MEESNYPLPQPIFPSSVIQALLQKETLFHQEGFERHCTIDNYPHHWLQTDRLQLHQLHHQFFKDLTLNDQTIPQIKFTVLQKIFRHIHQLMWINDDRDAFNNVSSHFDSQELIPFIPDNKHEYPQFFSLTRTHTKEY